MKAGLCETDSATVGAELVADETPIPARKAGPISVGLVLRERGILPPALDEDGDPVDPSPLRNLSAPQREARMLGILETAALYGDVGAANAALAHRRWQKEMKNGKAPTRDEKSGPRAIRVVNSLAYGPGTPMPGKLRASG